MIKKKRYFLDKYCLNTPYKKISKVMTSFLFVRLLYQTLKNPGDRTPHYWSGALMTGLNVS